MTNLERHLIQMGYRLKMILPTGTLVYQFVVGHAAEPEDDTREVCVYPNKGWHAHVRYPGGIICSFGNDQPKPDEELVKSAMDALASLLAFAIAVNDELKKVENPWDEAIESGGAGMDADEMRKVFERPTKTTPEESKELILKRGQRLL